MGIPGRIIGITGEKPADSGRNPWRLFRRLQFSLGFVMLLDH